MRFTRRAWLVWAIAVAAYLVGVLQRTSLGVAGLDAAARLEVSAAALSTLAVVQFTVYAGMQIPVGLMVDRLGPRVLVTTGAVTMAAGQVLLAVSHSLPLALLARVLVGAGDAMTWLSVIRLVAAWMPPRRVPLMTQVTALTGTLGQILSVIPLVALLHGPGWTAAFLSAASLSVLMAALAWMVVRDSPAGSRHTAGSSLADLRRGLAEAWGSAGTRLGFWAHVLCGFPSIAFLMLWGYPFLVSAERMSLQEASALFTLMAVASMVASPIIGETVARHPLRRSWLILGSAASVIGLWTVVLLLPGPAPHWLLVLLVVAIAVSGPMSVIGFDYARTFNPPGRLGTASGIVNMGGFSAGVVTFLAVGVVLDLMGAGQTYSLDGFRVAWSVQYVVWAVATVQVLRTRRAARAHMAEEGTVIPPLRESLRRRWSRTGPPPV